MKERLEIVRRRAQDLLRRLAALRRKPEGRATFAARRSGKRPRRTGRTGGGFDPVPPDAALALHAEEAGSEPGKTPAEDCAAEARRSA